MQPLKELSNIYECAVCYQPMTTAVSLNPCGHEFDETCANGILHMGDKRCPVCRVDVESFRPAYITRAAVTEMISKPSLTVFAQSLRTDGYIVKLENVDRNATVAKIFPLINEKLKLMGLHTFRLISIGKLVSPFKSISEYVPDEALEFKFYVTENTGHWVQNIRDHPQLFEKACSEIGVTTETVKENTTKVRDLFLNLYKTAVEDAAR